MQARTLVIMGCLRSVTAGRFRACCSIVPVRPIWVEFHAAIGGDRPEFDAGHPGAVTGAEYRTGSGFEHVIAALVQGSGYERVATVGIRRGQVVPYVST